MHNNSLEKHFLSRVARVRGKYHLAADEAEKAQQRAGITQVLLYVSQ